MLVLAALGCGVMVSLVGTMMAIGALVDEHQVRADVVQSTPRPRLTRLRERLLLRWDSTRRLR